MKYRFRDEIEYKRYLFMQKMNCVAVSHVIRAEVALKNIRIALNRAYDERSREYWRRR